MASTSVEQRPAQTVFERFKLIKNSGTSTEHCAGLETTMELQLQVKQLQRTIDVLTLRNCTLEKSVAEVEGEKDILLGQLRGRSRAVESLQMTLYQDLQQLRTIVEFSQMTANDGGRSPSSRSPAIPLSPVERPFQSVSAVQSFSYLNVFQFLSDPDTAALQSLELERHRLRQQLERDFEIKKNRMRSVCEDKCVAVICEMRAMNDRFVQACIVQQECEEKIDAAERSAQVRLEEELKRAGEQAAAHIRQFQRESEQLADAQAGTINDLTFQLNSAADELRHLRQQVENFQSNKRAATAGKIRQLDLAVDQLRQALENEEATSAQLAEEKTDLEQELSNLRCDIDEKNATVSSLSYEVLALKGMLETTQRTNEFEVEALKKDFAEQQQLIEGQLARDVRRAANEAEALRCDLQELQEETDLLRTVNVDLSAKLEEFTRKQKQSGAGSPSSPKKAGAADIVASLEDRIKKLEEEAENAFTSGVRKARLGLRPQVMLLEKAFSQDGEKLMEMVTEVEGTALHASAAMTAYEKHSMTSDTFSPVMGESVLISSSSLSASIRGGGDSSATISRAFEALATSLTRFVTRVKASQAMMLAELDESGSLVLPPPSVDLSPMDALSSLLDTLESTAGEADEQDSLLVADVEQNIVQQLVTSFSSNWKAKAGARKSSFQQSEFAKNHPIPLANRFPTAPTTRENSMMAHPTMANASVETRFGLQVEKTTQTNVVVPLNEVELSGSHHSGKVSAASSVRSPPSKGQIASPGKVGLTAQTSSRQLSSPSRNQPQLLEREQTFTPVSREAPPAEVSPDVAATSRLINMTVPHDEPRDDEKAENAALSSRSRSAIIASPSALAATPSQAHQSTASVSAMELLEDAGVSLKPPVDAGSLASWRRTMQATSDQRRLQQQQQGQSYISLQQSTKLDEEAPMRLPAPQHPSEENDNFSTAITPAAADAFPRQRRPLVSYFDLLHDELSMLCEDIGILSVTNQAIRTRIFGSTSNLLAVVPFSEVKISEKHLTLELRERRLLVSELDSRCRNLLDLTRAAAARVVQHQPVNSSAQSVSKTPAVSSGATRSRFARPSSAMASLSVGSMREYSSRLLASGAVGDSEHDDQSKRHLTSPSMDVQPYHVAGTAHVSRIVPRGHTQDPFRRGLKQQTDSLGDLVSKAEAPAPLRCSSPGFVETSKMAYDEDDDDWTERQMEEHQLLRLNKSLLKQAATIQIGSADLHKRLAQKAPESVNSELESTPQTASFATVFAGSNSTQETVDCNLLSSQIGSTSLRPGKVLKRVAGVIRPMHISLAAESKVTTKAPKPVKAHNTLSTASRAPLPTKEILDGQVDCPSVLSRLSGERPRSRIEIASSSFSLM